MIHTICAYLWDTVLSIIKDRQYFLSVQGRFYVCVAHFFHIYKYRELSTIYAIYFQRYLATLLEYYVCTPKVLFYSCFLLVCRTINVKINSGCICEMMQTMGFIEFTWLFLQNYFIESNVLIYTLWLSKEHGRMIWQLVPFLGWMRRK